MNSLPDFQKFFGKLQEGPYDKQFGDSNVSWLRVSSTFASSKGVPNTTLSGSPTIMVGALVHELGHQLDYIFGPRFTLLSSQTDWSSLINPDFATMDGMPCNAVFFQATCDAYPPNTPRSQIFEDKFPGLYPGEFFAAMFEHVESLLTGDPP